MDTIKTIALAKISSLVYFSSSIFLLYLAGSLGFEPRYSAPKADVLPLDDKPVEFFLKT